MPKTWFEHPTAVALMMGVKDVGLDTKVELEVDDAGYLLIHVTDEKLDRPLPERYGEYLSA
jgi:hypothetical protein